MGDEIKQEEIIEEELVEEVAVPEEVEEEESLPETVEVGGKEYTLIKTGAEQAVQVSGLLNWLGNYGEKIAAVIAEDSDDSALAQMNDAWQMVSLIGKISSPEALVDLFSVAIGCSKKVSVEHFSINILVDGVLVMLSQEEYAKVVSCFF